MLRFGVMMLCALGTAGVGLQTKKAPAPQAKAPAAAPAPVPKKEMTVPYKAGEVREFAVGWSSYVTAGTATVSVKEKKPSFNSVAYYVVAEGRPTSLLSKLYTLYYKADTLIDVYSL